MKSKPLIILIILSFILIIPLLSGGFYISHDGELHLARIASYSNELKNLQFPIRWASTLNYGYGYPIFNFVYPLPYLLSSTLYFIGLPLDVSFKIILALSMIGSALAMFFAVKLWLKNKWAALLSAIVYTYAPYRILDIYVRAAFGEAVAFVFPPLAFYGFLVWAKKKKASGLLILTLSITFLILSHNALAIIFMAFLSAFFLFETIIKSPKLSNVLKLVSCFIAGLSLSAFFWLPALFELKFTLAKTYLAQKDFHDYFINFKEFIYMPWSFNPENTPTYIGIISLFLIVIFISQILVFKQKRKPINYFLLFTFLLTSFLTISASKFFWEKISLIQFFQVPWRFFGLIIFIISLISSRAIVQLKKQSQIFAASVIIGILFITTIPILRVQNHESIDENYFNNYPKSTTWHNEASPIWTAGEAGEYPKQKILIEGQGQILNQQLQSIKHRFKTSSQSQIRVIDNTIYFPGWKAFVDDQETEIQFQDSNYRGLITFNVPEGEHQIKVIFTKTKIRMLSEIISLGTLLLLIIIFANNKTRKMIMFQ